MIAGDRRSSHIHQSGTHVKSHIGKLAIAASLFVAGGLIGARSGIGAAADPVKSMSGSVVTYGPRTEFVPISSYRTFDSRLDSPAAKLPIDEGNNPLSVYVGNSDGQTTDPFFAAPGRVVAVTYNVQAVQTEGSGFIHVDGIGYADGSASTLVWSRTGERISNSGAAYVVSSELDPEDARGELGIFIGGTGRAHVIIDITGYYVEASS